MCSEKNVINKKTKVCKFKRTLSRENLCKLKTCLEQRDWSSVIQCNDVDDVYAKFINLYKLKLNSCCTVKKYKVKDVQKQKPWITRGFENACKKKKNSIRDARTTQTVFNTMRYRSSETVHRLGYFQKSVSVQIMFK